MLLLVATRRTILTQQALKTLKMKEEHASVPKEDVPARPAISRRPEVLDDFIRNVLLKLGMVRVPTFTAPANVASA